MQHLTFLDSSTMGDTALTPLVDFGRFQHYDTTAPEEVIERLQDTNIAITNKVIIGEETMRACKNLKLICVAATGTNCVDLAAAEKAGIPVCNVAGYSTASVTQHAIGLLINLASSMHRYAAEATLWSASPIFTRLDHPMTDLGGKTLGVAGLGNIGRSVAKAAQGLGMRVIALQRENASETPDPATEIPRVSKAEFFSQSDAISLHCPLTESTRNMINAETLAMMKPSAFLINTGRGDLIDESALAESLKSGSIAGAGLDVLTSEPPEPDHILLADDTPNLIITPHTAWASTESRARLLEGIVENIQSFLDGDLKNRVV